MPTLPYGEEFVGQFLAYDTANDTLKTGDAANITASWIKDGARSAATNSVFEVDATNAPGVYRVVVTAAEAQAETGELTAISSTADIEIIGTVYGFVRLPTVAPGASGGLPTVDASNRIAGIQGTITTLDSLDTAQDSQHATTQAALLDAAGIRAAVGLASADLDTQLGAIVADTSELQGDWTDGGRLDLLLDQAAAAGGGDATAQNQTDILAILQARMDS